MKLSLNLPLLEIEYELYALRKHLESMESHLEITQELEQGKMQLQLHEAGLEDDEAEWSMAMTEMKDSVDVIFPRMFRGSFLVVLWAVLEASIETLADVARKEKGQELRLRDIKGSDFLDQCSKYFAKVLRIPLADDQSWERLRIFQRARNVVAHNAGLLSEKELARFATWQDQGKGPEYDKSRKVLVPSRDYVERTLAVVDSALKDLMLRIDPNYKDMVR